MSDINNPVWGDPSLSDGGSPLGGGGDVMASPVPSKHQALIYETNVLYSFSLTSE